VSPTRANVVLVNAFGLFLVVPWGIMDDTQQYWRGVNNSRARQAWADMLASYQWDAFFTVTSSNASVRKHPLSLIESARRVVSGRPSDQFVCRRGFIAAEEFKLGDWHCHGLAAWESGREGFNLDDPLPEISNRLAEIGYSRIEPAKSGAAVAGYLSKYVIKSSPWEYDVWGTGWKLDKGNSKLLQS